MNDKTAIETILAEYCEQSAVRAGRIHHRYEVLWRQMARYIAHGGKRLRPRLFLNTYRGYGGTDDAAALHVAAAWELLHACLLVHDDIIDRDTVRHDTLNIAGSYQAIYSPLSQSKSVHYALSTALLAGDLLLMSAYDSIASTTLAPESKLTAQSYIKEALFSVAGGELIDTDSVLYPVHESDPYTVMQHKTASYTLVLPLQCGATLAGAPSTELAKLKELGTEAGIAFQLKDDLLGVFGDSGVTGKSNRSDVSEKKRTLLLQTAIANLSDVDSKRLQDLYAPHYSLSDEEVEEAVSLLARSGAKNEIETEILRRVNSARVTTQSLQLEEAARQELLKVIDTLANRTS